MIAASYIGDKAFRVTNIDVPHPGANEVCIKVAYSGVCGTDMHIYHGNMDQRVPYPMTIGHEMSGVVESVGEGVTGVKSGDKVVVRPLDDRGATATDKGYNHICKDLKFIGIDSPGSMQQYWVVPDFVIHKLPDTIDLKIAALIEPLAVACHDVKMSGLKPDERVVVLGGGPIGMLVAMVARHNGGQVIISEINPKRIALARELGFEVVNPVQEDLVDRVSEITGGYMADVVFEVAGVQPSVDSMTKVCGIRGRVVMVAIHAQPRQVSLFDFFWKEIKLIGARVYERDDYETAIALVAAESLPLDRMITAVRPLTEIQDAFSQIDENPDGMKVLLDCQK